MKYAGVSVVMRSQPKGVNLLKPKTYFMYHKIEHSEILCSAQHEFVFCVDLRTNSDYFSIPH
jgi:hypothetical protein